MFEKQQPKVRYVVKYDGKQYEYALHSGRSKFIRNIADIVNLIEYCTFNSFKKNLYRTSESLYNFTVTRLVNDEIDGLWHQSKFHLILTGIIDQIIADAVQRYS